MSDDLATLVAVCEKAAQSKFPVTIDPAAVLPVVREAATALTEARAEIERLRGDLVNERRVVTTQSEARVAAESELSTLRARVREVVGLGLDVISEERGWGTYPRMEGSEIYTDADVFSRAARQLMEEMK